MDQLLSKLFKLLIYYLQTILKMIKYVVFASFFQNKSTVQQRKRARKRHSVVFTKVCISSMLAP